MDPYSNSKCKRQLKKGTGSEPERSLNLGEKVVGSVPVPFFNGASRVRKKGTGTVAAVVFAASQRTRATEPVPFSGLAFTV